MLFSLFCKESIENKLVEIILGVFYYEEENNVCVWDETRGD
jgi:hypothetical protein